MQYGYRDKVPLAAERPSMAVGFRAMRSSLKQQRNRLGERIAAEGPLGRLLELTQTRNAPDTRSASPDRLLLELAAHDLRNPLSGVLTAAQFLIEDAGGVLSGDQLVLLRSIESSAHFMLRLVEDMVELSRFEMDNLKIELHSVEIGLLVEHVVAINRTLAENRRISIELGVKQPAATVTADPVKLVRAVEALLTSAIRTSRPDGKIELQVDIEAENVLITIRSDDSAHSSDTLKSLFHPSPGSPPKRKFAEEWAALTLAFAKGIIEAHHGTVRMETGERENSSVVISLPLSERVKVQAQPKRKSRREGKAP
jgi:signal transduction histidine kinase